MKAYLILEDGSIFIGEASGVSGDVITRLFFNTQMAGYLEIITDPAVRGRAAVFTYPVLGNYGVNAEDAQSERPRVSAVIAREISANASNFRSEGTFGDYLAENSIPVLTGIDTRKLTGILRDKGNLKALITANPANIAGDGLAQSLKKINDWELVIPVEAYRDSAVISEGENHAAILDLGCKNSFIDSIKAKYSAVKLYNINDAGKILEDKPKIIFVSQGPGDPRKMPEITEIIRQFANSGIPVTGVGLGHLLIAAAMGAGIRELSTGRHGGNLPVKDVNSGKVLTTTQCTDYEIIPETLNEIGTITHTNINDGGIEGVIYQDKSVQGFSFDEIDGGQLIIDN